MRAPQANDNAVARIAAADPVQLRKHGAVGVILACYVLSLVLLQLLLLRVGPKPVFHGC